MRVTPPTVRNQTGNPADAHQGAASTVSKKHVFFENLDGFRFLCFLSVFFSHGFFTNDKQIENSGTYQFIKFGLFGNGGLGVNFFFVLSGFLITYLLIVEKKLNGQIDIKKFWLRRILRIWPLYYACVAFGFYIFPLLKTAFGQVPNETAHLWTYLTFLNNFDYIKTGSPDASILSVLWSVAIEEQFYFFWPVLLYLLPVKRYYIAFILVILISLVFRTFNPEPRMLQHHTLSCIGDMAVGAFGAWLVSERSRFKSWIVELRRYQIFTIYMALAAIYFFKSEIFYQTFLTTILERLIIAIIVLFVILEQSYSQRSFFKFSNFKTVSKLGLITYGLYCLHFIGILIATNTTKMLGLNTHLWQVLFLDTAIAYLLTVFIAKLSYKYFEKPFLKLKDRFAYITK